MNNNFSLPYQVVLLGDSITQYGDKSEGWVALLREEYAGKCQFTNLGISGLNSSQFLGIMKSELFEKMLPRYVDLFIVSFGANDAAYGLEVESEFHQGVEISVFTQNLIEMAEICRKYSKNICFMAPPPLKEYMRRNKDQTEKYSKTFVETAKEIGIQSIDIRNHLQPDSNIHIDGIHMNKDGNYFIYQTVQGFIGEKPFWREHWSKWQD